MAQATREDATARICVSEQGAFAGSLLALECAVANYIANDMGYKNVARVAKNIGIAAGAAACACLAYLYKNPKQLPNPQAVEKRAQELAHSMAAELNSL